MLENKNNIIEFPLERRMAEVNRQDAQEEYYAKSNQYDECVELARYCVDLIQVGMNEQDFIDHNFDPEDNEQLTDMFVILNLLVASLLRTANIKHILQDDLDDLLDKIQYLESTDNDIT